MGRPPRETAGAFRVFGLLQPHPGGADDPADRSPGTLALTLAAVAQGVQLHRVHDVRGLVQGLRLWQAVNDNKKAET